MVVGCSPSECVWAANLRASACRISNHRQLGMSVLLNLNVLRQFHLSLSHVQNSSTKQDQAKSRQDWESGRARLPVVLD